MFFTGSQSVTLFIGCSTLSLLLLDRIRNRHTDYLLTTSLSREAKVSPETFLLFSVVTRLSGGSQSLLLHGQPLERVDLRWISVGLEGFSEAFCCLGVG